jgi:hypothetical protein
MSLDAPVHVTLNLMQFQTWCNFKPGAIACSALACAASAMTLKSIIQQHGKNIVSTKRVGEYFDYW